MCNLLSGQVLVDRIEKEYPLATVHCVISSKYKYDYRVYQSTLLVYSLSDMFLIPGDLAFFKRL